jgi:hypothetical protein
VRAGNPQKVSLSPYLLISLHLLGVPTAHEERRGTGARRGCPEEVCAPGRGPRRGPEEPQRKVLSGRLVESLEERSGIGASEMCPLREDGRGACPTLFSSKWLKSSVERLSGKSLGGSDRASFGGAKRRKGAHSPRSAGSCDPVMEPIRSFQTVSPRTPVNRARRRAEPIRSRPHNGELIKE